MDKNAIKKYAVWARRELISRVSQRAALYDITEQGFGDASADSVLGRVLSAEEKQQRQALIAQVCEKGYEQVLEEIAYTWFNRFIALRFMEVNGYLPSRIRVFTDDANNFKPQILAEAINMELDGLNMEKVYALKNANDDNALYKYLIIVQCNALSVILPGMFQKISDYTELLFPDNLLRKGSVIEQMVSTIPEEDWTDQVQIIGWLYQYYNIEPKAKVFGRKAGTKIKKDEIAAATQLFTPDWIVRYMVENSLGRIFIDKRKHEGIYGDGLGMDDITWEHAEERRVAIEKEIAAQMGWKYFLPEAPQEQAVQEQLFAIQRETEFQSPEELRVIDPCCGSGHILVYMFDVLVQIYEDRGYTTRDAVAKIIENNLWGLDIDDRAAQLSYFAVMMKARRYDGRFFNRGLQPHVYAIRETNSLVGSYKYAMRDFLLSQEHQETLNYLMDAFIDAKEYGSILQLDNRDYEGLKKALELMGLQTAANDSPSLWYDAVILELPYLLEQAIALTQKYHVVATNPPYMAVSAGDAKLYKYVNKNYRHAKSDLFAVFMIKCNELLNNSGFQAMITQQAWMFLSSYEDLRRFISNRTIVNMAHLGARAFEEIGGEVVQTTAFVLTHLLSKLYNGTYIRLVDAQSQEEKEDKFLKGESVFCSQQNNFDFISSKPIAYWMTDTVLDIYRKGVPLGEIAAPRKGNSTSDNNRFLRLWFEVESHKMNLHSKEIIVEDSIQRRWYPYNKGGGYRKWYGFNEYLVDWYNDAAAIRSIKTAVIANYQYFMKPGLTWSTVSTSNFSIRWFDEGFIFDNGGCCIFELGEKRRYLAGLLNSNVFKYIFGQLNPTLNFQSGEVAKFPVILKRDNRIDELVEECVRESKEEYDSYETSWDFQQHPLVLVEKGAVDDRGSKRNSIEASFEAWKQQAENRFNHLKANEEELNRFFIDIYGLQDELTPDVEEKDVTVRRADLQRDVRGFISYAVGCIFGRYSLDKPGLLLAGYDKVEYRSAIFDGDDPELEKFAKVLPDGTKVYGSHSRWVNQENYTSFNIDVDNILPICDDEYFEDDIVGRFVKFVEVVYGAETLEENLKFIADALGGKGSPREVIRSYFLNGFYADHLKVYQKRPIYWLFDSGKNNGFKCLIYMHRYQPDTIARIRTDYVHEQQSRYRTAIADLENQIANAGTGERVKLTKQLAKLQAQAEELRIYEEKIHHLADQMIQIDLDDGVKVNYAKFQNVLAKIK